MEECWRWFGSDDPITLAMIRQAGAQGIVTALHEQPIGTPWPREAIAARRAEIEAAGLRWSVVESIPTSDAIKTRAGAWREHIDAWCDTVRALAAEGVKTICYNFMPVVDWTRTDLDWPTGSGARALRFDPSAFALFDVHLLGREGAAADHTPEALEHAGALLQELQPEERERLQRTIIQGLPGTDIRHDSASFRHALDAYRGMTAADLHAHLRDFLRAVVPVAAEVGARLCVHPDDPPRPLFGLPRVVSNAADIDRLLAAVDDAANGLTLCTGSLGAGKENDCVAIAERFATRIHFAHLRNVAIEADGGFHEAAHLEGDVPMPAVVDVLLREEGRRGGEPIPMRPDHGHRIGPDDRVATNPGYPYVGRLRGLAELRGVIAGLRHRPG